MKTEREAIAIICEAVGYMGAMISSSKTAYTNQHPGNHIVFNGNIFADGFLPGKLWWGDIDITIKGAALLLAAKEIGTTLYVLQEMDGRDTNELQPEYKKLAVWSTE